MSKLNKEYSLTIILIIIVIALIFLNINKLNTFEVENTNNIIYDKVNNTIYLDSLTLRQKIAQMIITYGKEENKDTLQNMFIGGIYLTAKPDKINFIDTINKFQDGAVVPFFVSTDLEGCGNPFENFRKFPSLREIKTKEEAYQVGYEEGELLRELKFNINFAPVVDLEDNVWKCRNFLGTPKEIAEKAKFYIFGLQDRGIIATVKHYPGKTISIKDPHLHIVYASINKSDILPFEDAIKNNVSAIMVTHTIVNGSVDSESKPSVISEKLINNLRGQFNGLIITDEIRMLGLKSYYINTDQIYIDLFKAKNDLILNFDLNPKNIDHMISVVENAVMSGEINKSRIDDSVIRILNAKGIKIII